MPLNYEELLQILKLVDQSHFDYLELETDELKLVLQKGAASGTLLRGRSERNSSAASKTADTGSEARLTASTGGATEPKKAVLADSSGGEAQRTQQRSVPVEPPAPGALDRGDTVPIVAPMVGTFYIAPEPGAPPFVEVGSTVDSDTTVGLIEVMKVFNAVKAGVRGTIVRRLVENGQFVEYGQPLFLVRPAESERGA